MRALNPKPAIHACLLLTAILCVFLGVSAQGAAYSILDLGTLPNGYGARGIGLNYLGQVVGGSADLPAPLPPAHAFRTDPNSPMTTASDLGTLGGRYSSAFGINILGQSVGISYIPGDAAFHGFRTQPNGPITAASDLGTLGGTLSYARQINDSGQVVGQSYLPGDKILRAFRTSPNGVIDAASDLGFLPGADSSTGVAINASGQVVGWSAPSTLLFDHAHAFRTAPNGPITPDSDLGTLGGDDIRPVAINASGQVIGTSNLVNGSRISHAFRTSPNGLITPESDLGTLGGSTSEAGGINDWGQVVGIAMLPGDVNSHPYLANMGSPMQDLTTLIEPNTGWRLGEVHGINNLGQICGEGIFGGQLHAFLLTPTPEPASLALALGFFALTARLRKRIGGGDHSHASTDNRPRIN